ncbi:MAG: FAD/NAD(P)-binding protein [Defluviitaleaceae bacterium]|nr:FAD/NAD(P)-binding protein [Defluviitaleaceae bacterium]
MCNSNILVPTVAKIVGIRQETGDVKTFVVEAVGGGKPIDHMPGHCVMLSIPGVGEAMFSITSSPTNVENMEFSIKAVGQLTNWLHRVGVGQSITIRGPLGNHFPVEGELLGKNLMFIAGGIGLAPLRSVINYVRHNRQNYGAVDILYCARSSADLVFRKEIEEHWVSEGLTVTLAVDRPEDGWPHRTGFAANIVRELNPDKDKIALVCGPPIMIKTVAAALYELGYTPAQVYTTLELRMKCGVGTCGRCNIGSKYACVDGPVFRCDVVETLPDEF